MLKILFILIVLSAENIISGQDLEKKDDKKPKEVEKKEEKHYQNKTA